MRLKPLILCGVIILNGCAFGQKTDYSNGAIMFNEFTFNDTDGCSIDVNDKRPYILSGDRSPDFVGINRALYGNTYDISTKSGDPLADDLTKLFANSYKKVVGSTCNESEHARKEIIYTLYEWKTDQYRKGWFSYDVGISVAIDGVLVSKERVSDKLVLSGDFKLNHAIVRALNEIHSNKNTAESLKR